MELASAEILLVTDDPDKVALVSDILKDVRVLNHLSVAHNEAEASAILQRPGAAPAIDLMVVDRNLLNRKGSVLLAGSRKGSLLRRIPVFVADICKRESAILRFRISLLLLRSIRMATSRRGEGTVYANG